MHEYSVVASLIELCEENALLNNAKSILKVVIEVGERSGVDNTLLLSAFDTFKVDSAICANSTLEILPRSVELLCNSCSSKSLAKGLTYAICPNCGGSMEIIFGRELNLLSLEME